MADITFKTRLIGKEDILFDVTGSDTTSSFVTANGVRQTITALNAKAIPLPAEVRNLCQGATTVSDGMANIISRLGSGGGGITPHIGENGNWFIGTQDTGVPATGPQGPAGPSGSGGSGGGTFIIPEIDPVTKNWIVNGVNTGVRAVGEKGDKGDTGNVGPRGPQGTPGSGGSGSVNEMTSDTVIDLNLDTTDSARQTAINECLKNLGGFTLTFKIQQSVNFQLANTLSFQGFYNGTLIIDLNKAVVSDVMSLTSLFLFKECFCKVVVKNGTIQHLRSSYGIKVDTVPCFWAEEVTFIANGDQEDHCVFGVNADGYIADCLFDNDNGPLIDSILVDNAQKNAENALNKVNEIETNLDTIYEIIEPDNEYWSVNIGGMTIPDQLIEIRGTADSAYGLAHSHATDENPHVQVFERYLANYSENTHNHTASDITDLNTALESKVSVTDLNTALESKVSVTDLNTALESKVSVTDLNTALESKVSVTRIENIEDDLNTVSGGLSNIATQLLDDSNGVGLRFPDYNNAVDLTALFVKNSVHSYTAPCNGWILTRFKTNAGLDFGYIDGFEVHNGSNNASLHFFLPIRAGSTYTTNNITAARVCFIPMIGGL